MLRRENIIHIKLSNGMRVILNRNEDVPIVNTFLIYGVGSRNEPEGYRGISHFIEHMLFRGSKKFKPNEIDVITRHYAGYSNAFTWLDFTAYFFTFPSDGWIKALEIEADRMLNSTFEPEIFQIEKMVVLEEARLSRDIPLENLMENIQKLAFRRHYYGHPVIGYPEDVEKFTRQQVLDYYKRFYSPDNAILILSGNFDYKDAIERILDLFDNLEVTSKERIEPLKEYKQRKLRRLKLKKKSEIPYMVIGFKTPGIGSDDNLILGITSYLLTSGRSSVLIKELVEDKEIISDVSSSFTLTKDPFLYTFTFELYKPDDFSKVEELVFNIFDRLKREGISKRELERVKNIALSDMIKSNERVENQSILLGEFEYLKNFQEIFKIKDRIERLTVEDIKRVFEIYFRKENAVIGCLYPKDGKLKGVRIDKSLNLKDGMESLKLPTSRLNIDLSKLKEPPPIKLAPLPEIKPYRFKLDNSIEVIACSRTRFPIVNIKFLLYLGTGYESFEKNGLANLTLNMLREGTRKYSSEKFSEYLEYYGIDLSMVTFVSISSIDLNLLSKNINKSLELMGQMIKEPIFEKNKLELQKKILINELKQLQELPSFRAKRKFYEIIYGEHPRSRLVIGNEKSLRELKREDIIDFYNKYYSHKNIKILVVGDIEEKELRMMLNEQFGGWTDNKEIPPLKLKEPDFVESQIQTIPMDKEQVHIYMGHIGIKREDKDYYKLLLFDLIFGQSDGIVSRLNKRIREQEGLTYFITSGITDTAGLTPGVFYIYTFTHPANTNRIIGLIKEELNKIIEEGISEVELLNAKRTIEGAFSMQFETNYNYLSYLTRCLLYNIDFNHHKKIVREISKITKEEVNQAIRSKIKPDKLVTVISGNLKGVKLKGL